MIERAEVVAEIQVQSVVLCSGEGKKGGKWRREREGEAGVASSILRMAELNKYRRGVARRAGPLNADFSQPPSSDALSRKDKGAARRSPSRSLLQRAKVLYSKEASHACSSVEIDPCSPQALNSALYGLVKRSAFLFAETISSRSSAHSPCHSASELGEQANRDCTGQLDHTGVHELLEGLHSLARLDGAPILDSESHDDLCHLVVRRSGIREGLEK
jgi:hypothetical protein